MIELISVEEMSRLDGVKEGRKQGRKQGIEQGIEQGVEQGVEMVAENMLRDGLGEDLVRKYTGLSKECLRFLRYANSDSR